MNNLLFILFYFVISCGIICRETILFLRCLDKNNQAKIYLGICSLFAALVLITYSVTIFLDTSTHYFLVSLFSSLYFASIDAMLAVFVLFIFHFTQVKISKTNFRLLRILQYIVIFDIISLLLNPIFGHCVDLQVRDTFIANYRYIMKPFYFFHLGVSYVLVAIGVIELLRKMFNVPVDYRKQYFYIIFGVSFIVTLNAGFLFVPVLNPYNFLDYSIWGYGIAISIVYWTAYVYPKKGMLDQFKSKMLENLNQGVVLFDYRGDVIIWNRKLEQIFPHIPFSENLTKNGFIQDTNLKIENEDDDFTLQSYIHDGDSLKPIRLDYSILKNRKNEMVGNIMVFSDYQMDIDILTGFQSWENFLEFPIEYYEDYCVVVIDINGLGRINKGLGKNEGDQIILQLSKAMRDHFSSDTYFVRGPEAHLIAISAAKNVNVHEIIGRIQKSFEHSFQYGIAYMSQSNSDIIETIEIATNSMREKKLLDQDSKHSNLLNSLIKALEECDDDTEAHVKRTQKLGKELGVRIGLTDAQQSDLSLLCLLHDIGKIGIPLDILNKPGKLSESEWNVITSHVEKGYQIAMSSPELERIAPMILHHHERWDGKGYPQGLSRETIPLLSRIIAVVDAYDAMVNDRSYRKALSQKEAFEELRKNAGTQFDPIIVSEFLAMLNAHHELVVDTENELDHSFDDKEEDEIVSSNVHPITYCRYLLMGRDKIYEVDDAFTALTGYTKEEALQIGQMDLIPEEDQLDYNLLVNKELGRSPFAFFEHRLVKKDGSITNVFCSGRIYYDSSLRQELSEIIVVDTSSTRAVRDALNDELSRRNEQVEHWENKYRRDSLTGLYNRESFSNDVEAILLTNEVKVMLLMIDVDHFKKFNDTFGHQAGDEFIKDMARCIEKHLRKNDLACRMGGDEFACAIIFPKKVALDRIKERSHEIFRSISSSIDELYPGMTISMGVCVSNAEYSTFKKLYRKADQQLYTSKANGRAQIS